jgi:hypothetical protein
MPDVKSFEELLQQGLGFKPVERGEVERVEASIKTEVVDPVVKRISEQQEELERARSWPVK